MGWLNVLEAHKSLGMELPVSKASSALPTIIDSFR